MQEIKGLIPHRTPFLFVHKLLSANDTLIVGEYTFTLSDFFFEGHFPDYPIVPGVVLVEALAQCGGAGIRQLGTLEAAFFVLASIEKAKFRKPIHPNDTVRLEIENIKISSRMIRQRGKVLAGDKVAAEAEWLCLVQAQNLKNNDNN